MSSQTETEGTSAQLPTVSLPNLANQWTGNLSNEDPLDKEYRLKRETADATHKRWRVTIFFILSLLGLIYVFILCVQILGNAQSTVDDKKWATGIIATIISGSIGFATGKAIS